MPVLTRTDEIILLAVWRLKNNAYGVSIADMLSRTSGKTWLLGAVYVPLDRLEKKGYLASSLGESTPQRGGRSKRLYRVTPEGLEALITTQKLQSALWKNVSLPQMEKDYEKK